jgi:hypothetical protein
MDAFSMGADSVPYLYISRHDNTELVTRTASQHISYDSATYVRRVHGAKRYYGEAKARCCP